MLALRRIPGLTVASFATQPALDFLSALASPKPTPAGGSAAAMAAAVGTSLLVKTARIARRTSPEHERASLDEAVATLELLWRKLAAAIDRDVEAYDQVIAAAGAPSGPAAGRASDIQAALRLATEVPLDVMRFAVEALAIAPTIAEHSTSPMSADVDTGVELVATGLRVASACVGVNVAAMQDAAYADGARRESELLGRHGAAAAASARAALGSR